MKAISLAFAMLLLVAMASAGYKSQCTSLCRGYCSDRCDSARISQPNCACARYGGVCCIGRYPLPHPHPVHVLRHPHPVHVLRHPHPVHVFAPAPAPAPVPVPVPVPAPAPLHPAPYPHAKWPYWRPHHKN